MVNKNRLIKELLGLTTGSCKKYHNAKIKFRDILSLSLVLLGLLSSCQEINEKITEQNNTIPEKEASTKDKTIMAVFAHPDDELSVAPILTKYAKEGAKVQLVIVTDGRYGTGQTDLKPGEELTILRNGELDCAAEHMGIEKPIWMGYHDQLKLQDGFFGHVPYIQQIMHKMDSLVSAIKPDVIITWGPDGSTNHMDHRIVGASITQVYLSRKREKHMNLFYVALPSSSFQNEDKRLLRGVADEYLTTIISYSKEDLENSIRALKCYKSQFSEETMQSRADNLRAGDYKTYFRPLTKANTKTDNLFIHNN
tara:strand:- start:33838 stop:34767 length:930 start_codon:yes stop_codon:yes gene_type:complete